MKKLAYLCLLPLLLVTFLSINGSGVRAQSQVPSLFLPFIPGLFTPGPGTVTGLVINASSPVRDTIPGAQVCIGASCGTTDENGTYRLEGVDSGDHMAVASADDFISVRSPVLVRAYQETQRDFVLSQKFTGDQITMRIVVTWDATLAWPPEGWENDLNANLWLSVPGPPTHIFYGDLGNCKTFPNSCLEQEYRQGFGPETLAIRLFENATYYYGVLNENQGRLGVPPITRTKASVQVYGETGTMYSFDVPTTGDGDFWYLFKIDALDGKWALTQMNCITLLPPEGQTPTCEAAPPPAGAALRPARQP